MEPTSNAAANYLVERADNADPVIGEEERRRRRSFGVLVTRRGETCLDSSEAGEKGLCYLKTTHGTYVSSSNSNHPFFWSWKKAT